MRYDVFSRSIFAAYHPEVIPYTYYKVLSVSACYTVHSVHATWWVVHAYAGHSIHGLVRGGLVTDSCPKWELTSPTRSVTRDLCPPEYRFPILILIPTPVPRGSVLCFDGLRG